MAQALIKWEKDPYVQNTIFNIFLFSLSLSLFLNWYFKDSFTNKIICIFLLLTIPRFFAHAHFHATDIPMTSMLLFFILIMDKSLVGKYFWVSGIVLGFFLSIKITSILLAVPVFLCFFAMNRGNPKWLILKCLLIFGINFYQESRIRFRKKDIIISLGDSFVRH